VLLLLPRPASDKGGTPPRSSVEVGVEVDMKIFFVGPGLCWLLTDPERIGEGGAIDFATEERIGRDARYSAAFLRSSISGICH
jgi:hypothetical protein